LTLADEILSTLPDGEVQKVRIGTHWTAVVLETKKGKKCGLASTMAETHEGRRGPDIPEAGHLERFSGRELAQLIHSNRSMETSIGAAAINALLPFQKWKERDKNAVEVLAALGKDKRVALVGRFPFTSRIRDRVGELTVLEKDHQAGELPESAAPDVFARSEVIAITGMTFINNSLESLLKLCPVSAFVMVLGPSTPLSPILFEYGVNILSGAIVEDTDAVLHILAQGGNFRQLHQAGIRLISLESEDFHTQ
jgi:uncharacterized protein (DUF4213/DUF364 family)